MSIENRIKKLEGERTGCTVKILERDSFQSDEAFEREAARLSEQGAILILDDI